MRCINNKVETALGHDRDWKLWFGCPPCSYEVCAFFLPWYLVTLQDSYQMTLSSTLHAFLHSMATVQPSVLMEGVMLMSVSLKATTWSCTQRSKISKMMFRSVLENRQIQNNKWNHRHLDMKRHHARRTGQLLIVLPRIQLRCLNRWGYLLVHVAMALSKHWLRYVTVVNCKDTIFTAQTTINLLVFEQFKICSCNSWQTAWHLWCRPGGWLWHWLRLQVYHSIKFHLWEGGDSKAYLGCQHFPWPCT